MFARVGGGAFASGAWRERRQAWCWVAMRFGKRLGMSADGRVRSVPKVRSNSLAPPFWRSQGVRASFASSSHEVEFCGHAPRFWEGGVRNEILEAPKLEVSSLSSGWVSCASSATTCSELARCCVDLEAKWRWRWRWRKRGRQNGRNTNAADHDGIALQFTIH